MGVLPYLDDIIIANKEFDKHLASIRNVFDRLKEHNLKIKLSKCTFAASKLLWLGMLISKEGIRPDPEKISTIMNLMSTFCASKSIH